MSKPHAPSNETLSNETNEASPRLRRRDCLLAAASLAVAAGCPNADPAPTPFGDDGDQPSSPSLELTVVDDPPLAAAIDQQWKARAESPLVVTNLTSAELLKRKSLSTDAVIYPNGLIGELIQRNMLLPLKSESLNSHILDRSDIFSLPRLREMGWGREFYGVSLGSPTFTLMLRGDLTGGKAPTDWTQYAAFAEELANQKPADATIWAGAAEPLKGRWAAEVLLARAASYARRRDTLATLFDIKSMEALIDSPAFVRALEELAAIAEKAPQSLDWTPADAAQAVLNGECGMTISWLRPTDSPASKQPTLVIAELPSGSEAYDRRKATWVKRPADNSGHVTLIGASGRMGSVTRLSGYPKEAFRMLSLLSSADWSRRICPDSNATAPYRESHVTDAETWLAAAPKLARPHVNATKKSLNRSDWLFSPRLPGRTDYLTALAEQVRSAAQGEAAAKAALESAAQAWNEITNQRGVEAQQAAYQASLAR